MPILQKKKKKCTDCCTRKFSAIKADHKIIFFRGYVFELGETAEKEHARNIFRIVAMGNENLTSAILIGETFLNKKQPKQIQIF